MADRGFRGRPTRTERADRLVNEGHSRGLDQALANTEASIRKMKTERVYAFDKNGKEISHSTTGHRNNTEVPVGYNYKDSIITHNHPKGKLSDSIAGRVGTVLSGADIVVAVGKNVSEMRNVTPTYTYSLKRPKNGWGISTSELLRVFSGNRSEYYNKLKKRQNEYLAKSNIGESMRAESLRMRERRSRLTHYRGTPENYRHEVDSFNKDARRLSKRADEINDRANVGIQWQIMKEYAKKYGWSLTRKKTN